MNLYEILLPMANNAGHGMQSAHTDFHAFLIDHYGGYTKGRPASGYWRNGRGIVIHDYMVPYRVACEPTAWLKIVARAFELFPDQEAIFHAQIGVATIEARPALPVNDLAAIDQAQERHNRLLYECYLSGQISEEQWELHCQEDKSLAKFYPTRRWPK